MVCVCVGMCVSLSVCVRVRKTRECRLILREVPTSHCGSLSHQDYDFMISNQFEFV